MQWLFLLIVAAGLVVLALNAFVGADPAVLARLLRRGGGYAALILAAVLALTGRLAFAVPLAAFGFMLLGGRLPYSGGFPGRGRPSPGQTSRVRTPTVEMSLDHDTGALDGRVLTGRFAGRSLSALGLSDLLALRAECGANDPKALPLVEAYLDRHHQGWRGEAGAGDGQARGGAQQPPGGPMTRNEAYDILGLAPGASEAEIHKAHRQLMKKMHPDQGGSNYLAAKVNEAKDLLLRRGRA